MPLLSFISCPYCKKNWQVKDNEIITTIECEICHKRTDIAENVENEAAYEILEIRDAMGKKLLFCGPDCMKVWLQTYKCPYQAAKAEKLNEYLPEAN